nr:hypothetical protein [Tanacetum cinerariifolium]
LVEIVNKQVITPAIAKAVEKTCEIYGGAHVYNDCIATDSNQPSVCVATDYHGNSTPDHNEFALATAVAPNNNNRWIEWDVPLGGEMDEPMVDPKFDEMDDDDDDDVWGDDDEWLMAPVTPSRATMDNLEYRHGVLTRKMKEVSDAEVADNIANGEIHPRVATVEEQVQTLQTAYMKLSYGTSSCGLEWLRWRVARVP